ncbi:MAG: choice-of-anchor L domain-containing protein, partial [Planctomycetota bacterium]
MQWTNWLNPFVNRLQNNRHSRGYSGRLSHARRRDGLVGSREIRPAAERLEDKTLLTTLQVTTALDVVDGDVTDTASLIGNPGPDSSISLREAVLAANAEGGSHAVTFHPSLDFFTVGLQTAGANEDDAVTGDLDVKAELTILGNGADVTRIDAGQLDRAFHVHNGATLTLDGLSVQSGNVLAADFPTGGGVRVMPTGTLNLIDVEITNNTAAAGGGIENLGTTSILSSAIVYNSAAAEGGGIAHFGFNGNLVISNSTISGNTAGTDGGGIMHFDGAGPQIFNSTISDNTADSDFNESGDGGGIAVSQGTAQSPQLHNTIVAGNHDNSSMVINPDVSGDISGDSFNILGDVNGSVGTLGTGTDTVLAASGLSSFDVIESFLDFNGGRTLTHALVRSAANPAVDGGLDSNALDPSGGSLITDQRGVGFDRIVGAAVDVGAYELSNFVEEDYFYSTIDTVTIQDPTGGQETISLTGSIGFRVFFDGILEGHAVDDNQNGRDEVQAELIELNLSGFTGDGTPLNVTLNPMFPSVGLIEELVNNTPGVLDVDPFVSGLADSFFDVFFQVDVGGTVMFNDGTANRWVSTISQKPAGPDEPYTNTGTQPLFDNNGNPTGFLVVDEFHNTNPAPRDFGTAPDPTFPTTLASDGARHELGSGLFLGSDVTGESNGPSFDFNDGVFFVDAVQPGQTVEVDVTASQSGGLLNAWMDFNKDGDWDDAGEQIFTDQPLVTGVNALTFNVPDQLTPDCSELWTRFRLSTQAGLKPTGEAPDGEVEDYAVHMHSGAILVDSLDSRLAGLTADDLAENLVGSGITVSNVTFTGATGSAGLFTDVGGVTGLTSGLILSSGHVHDVIGPNCEDGITTNHGTPGDSDLDVLADFNGQDFDTFDASVLEFDFIPDKNAVTFSYVFSSDEYNEFVNSSFNDVFAFFVNGVNRATVPVQNPAMLDVMPNGGDNDLQIVAVQPGISGNLITVEFVDPGVPDSPLGTSVSGTAITVSLATDTSGILISTASEVIGELLSTGLVTAAGLESPDGDFEFGSGLVAPLPLTPLSGGGPAGEGPVAVNTVNNGNPFNTNPRSNPALFRNNDLDDGGGAIDTEMDGLTVVLTFAAEVTANQTNRIKIAIADTSDEILDANVMIQAGSFQSTELDFGDAPDDGMNFRYQTLDSNDGARHAIVPGFFLGDAQSTGDVDSDIDGTPTVAADGDDVLDGNDDEDGVVFTSPLVPGQLATVDVTSSSPGFLDAWIDFGGDGVFDLTADQILPSVPLMAGLNQLQFNVPGGISGGPTYARFRLSSTGGLLPFGLVSDGEVEDYAVRIGAAPGSIHGYKFEDVNGNGIDDDIDGDGKGDEPRLAGVTVTLTGDIDGDGQTDTLPVTTDANGEYGFVNLAPGSFTVAETPPPGSLATTPDTFTVTVGPNEELVALSGQAGLDPDDPRTEIVIGPELAFGNAFFGSIHGYKFEDLNVNGLDDGEPRLDGVTITLTGIGGFEESIGPITTVTGDNPMTTGVVEQGEYWFKDLPPGTYTVTETIPFGLSPTTPVSYTVTINSREELVALSGQAHLPDLLTFPDGDPRVEVPPRDLNEDGLPDLAFGNAFEGSIHGLKFEDLNGDGVRQANEPPLEGVEILLQADGPAWDIRTDIPGGGIEGAAAGLIGDKLYVSHGHGPSAGGGDGNRLYVYDTATDSWTAGPDAGVARSELAGAVLNDLYYVIGGRTDGAEQTVEVFDPVAVTWTQLADMPTGRGGMGAATVDGWIYVIGGRPGGGPGAGPALAANERFNGTNWETRAPLPVPVQDNYATVAIGTDIYVFGGSDSSGTPLSIVQVYDTVADTWSTLGTPMPTPRSNAAAGIVDGKVAVVGGADASGA